MPTGRTVLITGAAGGVGTKLVARFLQNGDTVVATDTGEDGLAALRAGLRDDARLVTFVADISDEGDCAALAEAARADGGGRVDVLVNCAGWFPIVPFEQMTAEQWRRVVDVNLTGPFLVTRAVLPLMKDLGWGRIVTFGSASVFDGTPGQSHYVAAKAGLVGFSRSLAREVGGYGITVNVVTPGLTVTPAVRAGFPQHILAEQRDRRALKRDEEPEDLVGIVAFLASPDADFITGQTINVDGGKFMP
jgi:NAD(P)-dependent dehydrogenase (short-subunit alcohol dehydrogenase family)